MGKNVETKIEQENEQWVRSKVALKYGQGRGILLSKDSVAALYRILEHAPSSPAAPQGITDMTLRRMLWDQHSCDEKYGDDGELQCNRMPPIDFKRDDLFVIEDKSLLHRRGSPAAPTPPRDYAQGFHDAAVLAYQGIDLASKDASGRAEPAGYAPDLASRNTEASLIPCSPSSPCGEMVAKGVCEAGGEPHEKDRFEPCENWRPTLRVCQNCGREEKV